MIKLIVAVVVLGSMIWLDSSKYLSLYNQLYQISCYNNNRAHFRILFSNNTTFLNFHNSYSTIQQVKKSADELQYDRPDFLSGRLNMTFISGPRNPPGQSSVP